MITESLREQITERRNAILQDWQSFLAHPHPLFAEVIERDKTELPNDFLPWAPGLLIASDYLLREAGYRPGSRDPLVGWAERNPGVFMKRSYGNRLMVRQCGEFWSVERTLEDQTLAFKYGPLPVFTREVQASMRLAEYCQPSPRPGESPNFPQPRGVASNLCWTMTTPQAAHWSPGTVKRLHELKPENVALSASAQLVGQTEKSAKQ